MIAIINYGAGNTKSVMNALDRLKETYILTDVAEEILSASKVIFPGVGNAKHAMNALKSKELDTVIRLVKKPLLGICVGMQLLYEYSEEGNTECLGIVEGIIKKFPEEDVVVPQIGWNQICFDQNSIFDGLDQNAWFYSVHSYYAEIGKATIASSNYGIRYSAAIRKKNFYGTQFHPEKSSLNGANMLKNFLEL